MDVSFQSIYLKNKNPLVKRTSSVSFKSDYINID